MKIEKRLQKLDYLKTLLRDDLDKKEQKFRIDTDKEERKFLREVKAHGLKVKFISYRNLLWDLDKDEIVGSHAHDDPRRMKAFGNLLVLKDSFFKFTNKYKFRYVVFSVNHETGAIFFKRADYPDKLLLGAVFIP